MLRNVRFSLVAACLLLMEAPSRAADIPELVRKAKPAVVELITYDAQGRILAMGSGFFINPSGWLITNNHVVSGAHSVVARTSTGESYQTVLKRHVLDVDLALVKFNLQNVPYLVLDRHTAVEGQHVLVIGNPEGLEGTVSEGIVSAIREDGWSIQFTAPISPGSSGSPVLNDEGKVIGMATLIHEGGQNLNFALSSQAILFMTKTLVDLLRSEAHPVGTPSPSPHVEKAIAEDNRAAGQRFLADNAKKPGVKVLPSGLQYKIFKAGTGPKPKDTDFVVTNYRGTFIDGKEFDSSEKNGGPVKFPVSGVIEGWREALKLMPVGSRWEIYIPSELAYGDDGARGDAIAPGETLIFDIELLRIKKAD
jgi:S1-C subfamily serine protease